MNRIPSAPALLLALSALAVGLVRSASAQSPTPSPSPNCPSAGALRLVIENPEPAPGDAFGNAVDAAGGRIFVGAFQDDFGAPDAGSVYVFDASTGALLRAIRNPHPHAGDWFGASVAAVGDDHVLIGALNDDTFGSDAGAAYLFNARTGALLLTLPPAQASDMGGLGFECASLASGRLVVSNPGSDFGAGASGSVYLFDPATGARLLSIDNPTPAPDETFGYALCAAGDRLLVGCRRDNAGAPSSGAVYLYDGLSGALLGSFFNPQPRQDDYFGTSAAALGGRFFVGANQQYAASPNPGVVYALAPDLAGAPQLVLANPEPADGDMFGDAIAAIGSSVAVSAPKNDFGAEDAGSVYVFDGQTGALQLTLRNPRPMPGDEFGRKAYGRGLAAAGGELVVGAWLSDAVAPDAGAVYVFRGLCPAASPSPTPTLAHHPAHTHHPTRTPHPTHSPHPARSPFHSPSPTPTHSSALTDPAAPTISPAPNAARDWNDYE